MAGLVNERRGEGCAAEALVLSVEKELETRMASVPADIRTGTYIASIHLSRHVTTTTVPTRHGLPSEEAAGGLVGGEQDSSVIPRQPHSTLRHRDRPPRADTSLPIAATGTCGDDYLCRDLSRIAWNNLCMPRHVLPPAVGGSHAGAGCARRSGESLYSVAVLAR